MCKWRKLQERRFNHQRRDMKAATWKKPETKENPLMYDLKKEAHTFTAQLSQKPDEPNVQYDNAEARRGRKNDTGSRTKNQN